MRLAKYNVTTGVKEQVSIYLRENELSFSELKRLILSKTAVPDIQVKIVTSLTQAKNSDQLEVKETLEKKAYESQFNEDKKKQEQYHVEALKDEQLNNSLNLQVNHIFSELNSLEKTLSLLKIKLERNSLSQKIHQHEHGVISNPAHQHAHEVTPGQTHQHVHETSTAGSNQTHNHEHGVSKADNDPDENKEAREEFEHLKQKIQDHKKKIQHFLTQQINLQKQLAELAARGIERSTLKLEISAREHARIGFNSSGFGLEATLSRQNWMLLTNSIEEQHKALEKKCRELISASELINYPYFFEQIPKQMEHFSLSHPERECLNHILKLMSQHLRYEEVSANTLIDLNSKKQLIQSQQKKVQDLRAKIVSLREENPALTSQNKHLVNSNSDLAASLEQNTTLRYRLGTSTLLLFALTLLLTIPLILTLNGVIPFFIAPVLLFTLVGAPPAILLLASIGVGIATAVYAYKVYSKDTEINSNKRTIENNNMQMLKNTEQLQTLQTTAIPELESKIKDDELIKDKLNETLQKARELASQSLKQATDLEPNSYSKSPFLKKNQTAVQERHDETKELSFSEQDEKLLVL